MNSQQLRIESRQRRWKKFGKAALSTNSQTSYQSKEIVDLFLGTPQDHIDAIKTKKDKLALENFIKAIALENYKFDDLVKIYQDIIDEKYDRAMALNSESSKSSSSIEIKGYVPPHLRVDKDNNNDAKKQAPVNVLTSAVPVYILTHKKQEGFVVRMVDVPDYISEEDIWRKCGFFGRISRVNLVKDRDTGYFRGIVFVNFYGEEDAKECVSVLNGQCWEGFVIKIDVDKRNKGK